MIKYSGTSRILLKKMDFTSTDTASSIVHSAIIVPVFITTNQLKWYSSELISFWTHERCYQGPEIHEMTAATSRNLWGTLSELIMSLEPNCLLSWPRLLPSYGRYGFHRHRFQSYSTWLATYISTYLREQMSNKTLNMNTQLPFIHHPEHQAHMKSMAHWHPQYCCFQICCHCWQLPKSDSAAWTWIQVALTKRLMNYPVPRLAARPDWNMTRGSMQLLVSLRHCALPDLAVIGFELVDVMIAPRFSKGICARSLATMEIQ
jgi:hypothetical protein